MKGGSLISCMEVSAPLWSQATLDILSQMYSLPSRGHAVLTCRLVVRSCLLLVHISVCSFAAL